MAKEKPAVIVFSTAYHPYVGGAEIAIEETISRLQERFDFYVVTHRMRRDLARREEYRGAVVIRCGFGTAVDRMFLFPFFACFAGIRIMRQKSRVLLWGVMVSYASIGAFFITLFFPRTPFILTLQEGDPERHLSYGKIGLTGVAWRLLLKRADVVTAISAFLARYARRRGFRGDLLVIPNGADIQKFGHPVGTQYPPHSKVVITTSRLVHKNGIDTLIRAIAEVKKEIPGIRCHIAGDGIARNMLEKLTRALGLEKEVIFLGAVPYDKVPDLLHGADIFVRPSRSEGMGSSFVEALVAALPIIGTRVGGIPDIIEDKKTGLFVAVDDSHDLAQKIILLIRDPALAREIATAGRKIAEARFSWETIKERYADIFQKWLVQPLRIVIVTPLLPPDVGGPGNYALHLGEEFVKAGHTVTMVSYRGSPDRRSQPHGIPVRFIPLGYATGLRHLLFFLAILRKAYRSDVVFALDQFSAGLPAAIACMFSSTPYVTRMEGDFLWESYVARTRRDITLASFYRNPPQRSLKERLIFLTTRWVARRAARVVYSSGWRKEMVERAMPGVRRKGAIIANVWPSRTPPHPDAPRAKVIIWAGRMIYLKNLHRLIRAFFAINNPEYELHLTGEGPEQEALEKITAEADSPRVRFFPPMPHADIIEKIAASAFLALPSLSDVGPNVIADAISTGTPFLLTQESGSAEYVREYGVLVDPLDQEDIASKMRLLMDDAIRARYASRIAARSTSRSWREAAEEWEELFHEVSSILNST